MEEVVVKGFIDMYGIVIKGALLYIPELFGFVLAMATLALLFILLVLTIVMLWWFITSLGALVIYYIKQKWNSKQKERRR